MSSLGSLDRACDGRRVLGYPRRQLTIVVTVVAVGAGGLAIDHWRRANPDVVAYLEALDRAAPPPTAREPGPREPLGRRPPARPRELQSRDGLVHSDASTPL